VDVLLATNSMGYEIGRHPIDRDSRARGPEKPVTDKKSRRTTGKTRRGGLARPSWQASGQTGHPGRQKSWKLPVELDGRVAWSNKLDQTKRRLPTGCKWIASAIPTQMQTNT
jgi:hypothetical protein